MERVRETTGKKRAKIGNNEDLQLKWKEKREMKRGRGGDGKGRLRQNERIDGENRLNWGGCIWARGANGEGEGEPEPRWLSGEHACRAFWLLYLIGSHRRAPFMCANCPTEKKNADNGLSHIWHWSRFAAGEKKGGRKTKKQNATFFCKGANYNKPRRHSVVVKTENYFYWWFSFLLKM